MCNRIYLTIIVSLLMTGLVSANLIFRLGDSDTQTVTVYNNSAVNMSDLWDNLDTPADIEHNDLSGKQGGSSGEYYHLDQSTYDKIIANVDNWITSLVNYFTKAEIIDQYYNKTDIDSMDFGETYTHLSNFTDDIGATSTYNATYQSYYDDYHIYWYNMSDGVGGGSGESYDQSLNTTDDVQFNSVQTELINSTTGGYLMFNQTSGSLELWV